MRKRKINTVIGKGACLKWQDLHYQETFIMEKDV